MSTFCPPAVVDIPANTPTKFGLFSVVRPFPTLENHWRQCGVEFLSTACGEAQVWTETCDSVGSKLDSPEPFSVTSDPFTVWSSWDCGSLGKDPMQHQRDAEAALLCAEERTVEEVFFAGYPGLTTPSLVGGGAVALNTDATPYTLAAGIGALEGAMGSVQCGEPVIHAPREVGALAARYHQTFGSGTMLRTALGSPIAFGNGYGNADPDGVPAPAGIVWLYATGPVYLAQTSIFMNPPTFEDALNRTTNQVTWEANRTFMLAVNGCASFAVAVIVGGEGGGGGGGGGGFVFPSP